MTLEVEVDRARCAGSGNCAYWAPAVFDLDEEGLAMVVGDPERHPDRVRDAARHCPTSAISLREG